MRGRTAAGALVLAAGLLGLAAVREHCADPAAQVGPAVAGDIAPRTVRLAPGEPLRLAVFGTSLTANDRWPEDAADTIAANLGRPVSLLRVARAGADSGWAVRQTDRLRAFEPHLVVVEFAINDADIVDGVSLRKSASNHRTLLDALGQDTGVILMTTNPARGLRGWARPCLSAYYDAYRRLAKETGAGLLDLAPRWETVLRETPGALPDGLHPAQGLGEQVIAPALAELVRQAMAPQDGS